MKVDAQDAYSTSFTPEQMADNRKSASRFWTMFVAARRHEGPNRVLQRKDEDAYHGFQWDPGDKSKAENDGRPALTVNLIAPTCDLITGDERANRQAMVAVPRGQSDVEGADADTQVLKYLIDQCDGDMELSSASESAIHSGVGWVEVDIRKREDFRDTIADGNEYEPFLRFERRENVWVDPRSRRNDLADARFLQRALWFDVDEACAQYPKFAKQIRDMIADPNAYADWWNETIEDNTAMPDPWQDVMDWEDDPAQFIDVERNQILVVETQYRAIETITLVKFADGTSDEFDKDNPKHVELLNNTPDALLDDMFPEVERKVMRVSHICGDLILQDERMPHKHGGFTLEPIYAYRDRLGRAYGVIRGLLDSQMDYNKRRSTALFLLVARRVLAETGAVKSMAYLAKMANQPNALIELEKGGLERIKFERDTDLVAGHVEMMGMAKQEIEQASGVNQEMRGHGPGDQSGRAIMARQAQGNLILAGIKDNRRAATKRIAYKLLSLAKQYMTGEMELRITEAPTGKEWLKIGGPNGISLAETRTDITIEDAPATASVRQQNLQILQDFLNQMPPEIKMALLPELIDAIDIPNKEKLKTVAEQWLTKMGLMPGQPAPMGGPGMPPPGGAPGQTMPQPPGQSGGPINQQPPPPVAVGQ